MNVDPTGLSPADARRIMRWASDGIGIMTTLGLRNPNPYINNLSANLTPSFLDPAPYLVCGEQVNWIYNYIQRREGAERKLDDLWFYDRKEVRTIPGTSLGHAWLCARSTCDTDKEILIDPWYGIVRECGPGQTCKANVPWWVPWLAVMGSPFGDGQ